MRQRDDQSLLDIAVAGRLIKTFVVEADSPAQLERNPLLSSAIAWQFSIVGEAANDLARSCGKRIRMSHGRRWRGCAIVSPMAMTRSTGRSYGKS